jgi:hypothetical protein
MKNYLLLILLIFNSNNLLAKAGIVSPNFFENGFSFSVNYQMQSNGDLTNTESATDTNTYTQTFNHVKTILSYTVLDYFEFGVKSDYLLERKTSYSNYVDSGNTKNAPDITGKGFVDPEFFFNTRLINYNDFLLFLNVGYSHKVIDPILLEGLKILDWETGYSDGNAGTGGYLTYGAKLSFPIFQNLNLSSYYNIWSKNKVRAEMPNVLSGTTSMFSETDAHQKSSIGGDLSYTFSDNFLAYVGYMTVVSEKYNLVFDQFIMFSTAIDMTIGRSMQRENIYMAGLNFALGSNFLITTSYSMGTKLAFRDTETMNSQVTEYNYTESTYSVINAGLKFVF